MTLPGGFGPPRRVAPLPSLPGCIKMATLARWTSDTSHPGKVFVNTDSSLQLSTRSDRARGLVATFLFRKDRFVTTLSCSTDGNLTPILRSVEGDADERWPPSPVVQELLRHDLGSDSFLAGIGRAGTSHWSLAVTVVEGAIEWDWACRLKAKPDHLGGQYALLDGAHYDASSSLIRGDGRGTVRCESQLGGVNFQSDTAGGRLSVLPDLGESLRFPCTVRWKYRFSIVDEA